ncbi:hypothetical protein ACTI_23530 [Actinoplanes sp. OR16]|uniref:SWIM zinc finger family protein n=1 Tax=Actinoplanes sp. OR16 TaxID=946334 RepID=UPI000F6F7347|nr:SWIM zinc finger family protein [Actinoplanes sp. OR16]BBH65668.1 hypothetical protein ACTI_23530 [Actinoplanes sp. OR16]
MPDRFSEYGRPIEVEGGLAVRSQRGKIGEQWWSRRFVDWLEGVCQPGRLARGRTYARKGQVMDFALRPGHVTARVQGSRPAPYQVDIRIPAYDEGQWTVITEALGDRALYRAALLAGEMPHEIVDLFTDLGMPLFPAELNIACSCPDWGIPCKHGSAALYVLAEAFDDDPFLVLAWRGRERDVLLDALRGTSFDSAAEPDFFADLAADEPLEDRLADFYSPGISLGRLRERPARGGTPPELLLRALDPPPVKVRHIPLVDTLRAAYRDLGASEGPRPS